MDSYFCDNQMNLEECLQELERHKWETGQYMNLPEVEESRMQIINYIPQGSANAISRKDLVEKTGFTDRKIRDLIEEARRETIIISNNDGSGYWLYPDNPTEREEELLARYVKQQESRAKSIFYALRPARQKMKEGVQNG